MTQIKPQKNAAEGKKEQVSAMFDSISKRYDFLNHFFSLNVDKIWRKKAVKIISKYHPSKIIDVASGTGDFALALSKLKGVNIINGIDISEQMLSIGRQKVIKQKKDSLIKLQYGDAENIPFAEDHFDAATVAFGVRNFENLDKGIKEIYRVLKKGSPFVVLEFSRPRNLFVKKLYYFYFKFIIPFVGKHVSKNQVAYSYLPESVMAFPERDDFALHLQNAGFVKVSYKVLTFGIVTLYISEK